MTSVTALQNAMPTGAFKNQFTAFNGGVKVSTRILQKCKRANEPVIVKNRRLNINAKDNSSYEMAFAA